jgi:hypothetical protein
VVASKITTATIDFRMSPLWCCFSCAAITF